MSVDPVTTNAKDGSFFGRYHYANNNPYKFVDPDGRAGALAACAGGPVTCAVGVVITIATAAKAVSDTAKILNQADGNKAATPSQGRAEVKSPEIKPSDVAGKTAGEIGKLAGDAGLKPKGSDPVGGKGSFIDPKTGEQRVLVHGDHAHVNDAAGNRLDVNGNKVPANSPAAHLPVKPDPPKKAD